MAVSSVTGLRYRGRAARWATTLVLSATSMLAAGCSGTVGGGAREDGVVVMAASSLTDVMETVFDGRGSVTVVLAASSTLVAQLAAGAEADVLITADAATMERAVSEGSVRGKPVLIAVNNLVLATPADNPGGVTGLADLARSSLLVGLCAPEVPCGALAVRALREAGVAPIFDTLEPNVRALATKISLGELDAGLVYATDARTAGLATVDAPELSDHLNGYYIASVSAEPRPEVQAMIDDFTMGGTGAKALHVHGFQGSDRQPVWPTPP